MNFEGQNDETSVVLDFKQMKIKSKNEFKIKLCSQ